ncbi:MAG TPA: fumarylacetoacetate hydrolase family protein [Casimicrobiaceae bacterium]|nr:fumarylacetoacetate hydrolase family protein [Casimicrobiaceae bacterium]
MDARRRKLLKTSAVAAGALAGGPAVAQSKDDVLFAREGTYIPVLGTNQKFQVRRIYCVGRNYAAHAIERGSDPTREPPFFFQKPTDAIQIAPQNATIDHNYPPVTKNYHYEVELVAALGKGGRNIPADKALDCVFGYAVGLDMTRRDLQNMMASEKKPWEIGKSFDHAAVVSHLHPASKLGHPDKGAIWLKVNGQTKQSSDLAKMIWNVAEQVSHLSQYYELFPGDIIYCGTPENVGPVVPGDVMTGHIDGIYEINVKVV